MTIKKRVFIMVGAPASGKSTWIKHSNTCPQSIVISTDEYRREMFHSLEEGNRKENQVKLFSKIQKDMKREVKNSETRTIYYDATNTNRKRRRALFRNIKAWSEEEITVKIIYFSVPLLELISRNNIRNKEDWVPENVLSRMYRTIQTPRIGVDCDSFEVEGVRMFDSDKFLNEYFVDGTTMLYSLFKNSSELTRSELSNIYAPHDCYPHHIESIDEHIAMCIDNAVDRVGYRNDTKKLIFISLFHDLGKSITKEMTGNDGVSKATYRGHADVSANYLLNFVWFSSGGAISEYLDAIEVVHQHMNLHGEMGEKNIRNNKLTENILGIGRIFSDIDDKSRIKGEVEANEL